MADTGRTYTIIGSADLETLVCEVNHMVSKGWSPLGGPVYKPDPDTRHGRLYQAMTREQSHG